MATHVAGMKRKRAEDADAKVAALPDVLKRNVFASKMMFVNSVGAGFAPVPGMKERTKDMKKRREYGTGEGAAAAAVGAPTGAKRDGDVLLIKGATGDAPAAQDVAKALPEPTLRGQLVVAGGKDKAEEMRKEQEREARRSKALTVLPMSGKELRNMHEKSTPKPRWHAPWKLHRVIPGHLGWVRTIAVDHSNEWFVTSGNDRTIKVWDLASGRLKLTLTKHISSIRGVAISDRSPYLFSCAEDGQVLCWDLETNKVIRSYHGHLNGVFCLTLHKGLDILATGGRDASVRLWDIRTKLEVHTMTGHQDSVQSLAAMPDPYIISGGQDNNVRIWDIAEGRSIATLTHHKKGVRALAMHPTEYTFASGAADNIKKWRCPRGEFLNNFSGHNAIVNTLSINNDNVMVSGGGDGALRFWDWKTGYNFQQMNTIAQPGSLESETAIYASTFDHSGSRLITGEADKTIKIWKEDETATEETHPIDWKPQRQKHF
eukprot:TRINITY_DN6519_c0_g1_i1.p1 TRINITY_DN6519_c0_g1~~TRINITY_DN6519_c0_g1_i1.p1  ORF type:complete len:488 (+),score=194.85 TRINITY_DN6519_c0_g1_i1:79-1542(+)